jgi:hypothetical protein
LLEFDSTVGTGAIHPTITFDSGSSELLDLSTMSATALQNFDGVIKNVAPARGSRSPARPAPRSMRATPRIRM